MTVQSTTARADYQGNNVTTLFTVPFYFLDNSHVKVTRTDNSTVPPTTALLVLGSDYVVTGAGVQIGGQVQTTVAPTSSQVLTVLRNVPFTQLIHYVPNDPFPAATHEQALDQLTMEVQELNEGLTHALQFPTYEPVPAALLPAASRANTIPGFDALGNLTYLPITASIGAGDLRTDTFVSTVAGGTGQYSFTPNVTTSLTLSRPYTTLANLQIHFDGVYQGPDQILSLANGVLTFKAAIPAGVTDVYVMGGTTLSGAVPPDLSVTDIKVAAGANISSDKLSYTPGWVAGAPRILTKKFDDKPNLLDCQIGGAVGTGNDDSSAFARALSAGVSVEVPSGTFHIGNVTGTGGLRGAGADQTKILTTVATGDALQWNGLGQLSYDGTMVGPRFHGFSMGTTVVRTQGALLAIAPSIGEISAVNLFDLIFQGGFDQLAWRAVSNSFAAALKFINYSNNATIIANPNNPDSGDSIFMGCLWNCGIPTGQRCGVFQISSGGLRIVSPKFNGGVSHYFLAADIAGKSVADLSLEGGSYENAQGNSVTLARSSASGNWGSINIKGVQFGGNVGADILSADPSGFLSDVSVKDCTLSQLNSSGIGVSVNYINGFHASGNKGGGTGGTSVGIAIGAGMTNWRCDDNQFPTVAVPYSNSAPTTGMINNTQSGTGTVVPTSALGSMFAATLTVPFVPPYDVGYTPTVSASVTPGSASGVTAQVGGVTNTGFTLEVLGLNNTNTVPYNWSAK